MQWLIPVSYTHLDVYKRQVIKDSYGSISSCLVVQFCHYVSSWSFINKHNIRDEDVLICNDTRYQIVDFHS